VYVCPYRRAFHHGVVAHVTAGCTQQPAQFVVRQRLGLFGLQTDIAHVLSRVFAVQALAALPAEEAGYLHQPLVDRRRRGLLGGLLIGFPVAHIARHDFVRQECSSVGAFVPAPEVRQAAAIGGDGVRSRRCAVSRMETSGFKKCTFLSPLFDRSHSMSHNIFITFPK
jgi:hypothetical protein